MKKVNEVLVKVEYHGQIWFEIISIKDYDAISKKGIESQRLTRPIRRIASENHSVQIRDK